MKNAKFNFNQGSRAATALALGTTVLAISTSAAEASPKISYDNHNKQRLSQDLKHNIFHETFSSNNLLKFLVDFRPHTRKYTNNHSSTHKYLSPAQIADQEISKNNAEEWDKVNNCEEGGNWHVEGSTYEGGLGISVNNWVEFGGDKFDSDEANATPAEQEVIGDKIELDMVNQKIIISKKILDAARVPDQDGCDGGW